jgi:hypothetical protein
VGCVQKGKFNVRSFYNILARKEASHFPWKSIWRTKTPSRVAFFTWTAVLGKIFTLDNLRKRNLTVINRCFLRKADGETINHLLLHCEIMVCFNQFGLSLVMPSKVEGLFAWWLRGRSRSAVVWKMVSLCLVWCLWLQRNARCFEVSERSLKELMAFFFYTLFTWTAAWLAPLVISYLDFLVLFSYSS